MILPPDYHDHGGHMVGPFYFQLGREVDDPEHLRAERYLIAKRAGRYNRPTKLNDEYLITPRL
jgi:hypothetical protein